MSSGLTTFDLNQPDLPSLLRRVATGEIQLPDFQRGWVWREDGISALIASVTLAYPIGAILMLKTGGKRSFFPRTVQGVGPVDRAPELLILDGQQRVTSLYQSLCMNEPVETQNAQGKHVRRLFYLDIRKCMDKTTDRRDAVISVPDDLKYGPNGKIDLSAPEREWENWMIPVRVAFDASLSMHWQQGFLRYHNLDPEVFEAFGHFQNDVLSRLQGYRVPSIELAAGTPHEAVCQVFENVNTGGVTLTIFELLTAMFSAEDEAFRLRADWLGVDEPGEVKQVGRRERLHEHRVLRGVRGRDFLQACTLLATYEAHQRDGKAAVGCRRKEMLDLKLAEFRSTADRIEQGFVRAARMLGRLRILEARNLPYASQLVPMAAIFASIGGDEESEATRNKLDQWYWCGVLGELYGSSTETRFALDVVEVIAWIRGAEEEPRTVRDMNFSPTRLRSLRTRNSAAYKGVAALLLGGGCRDLARGDLMRDVSFDRESIDIHHLFPKRWCEANKIPARDYNSVLNRTPLARRTNQRLGGSAPSIYLRKLESNDVTADSLDAYVLSHLACPEFLRLDDFQSFTIDRARRLLDSIETVTGKPINGRDSDAVVKAFGAALLPMPDDMDAPRTILYDRYVVLEELFGGGMSSAYKVLDKQSGTVVFLKRTRIDGSLSNVAMQREIGIYEKLERAQAKGTLKILDVHHDDHTLGLVTELATGGTLEEYVDSAGLLDASQVQQIGLTLCEALSELHGLELVHRDIKPANVLRVGDVWKLGDFGLAKNLVRMHSQRTLRGGWSPGFAPNEQIEGAEPCAAMDVYALGKVLTFMLTGQTDTDQVQTPAWRDLVRRCAHEESAARPSLSQVTSDLRGLFK